MMRRARRAVICAALGGILLGQGASAEPGASRPADLPEPVYEITIEASYDAESKMIRGTEHLRWRNTAAVPIEDLWFHHYLNAFANNRTTFMEESGGRLRSDDFDGKRWGWIEVSSMRLADGTDLKAVEEYLSPDDGNPMDRTVARYVLPTPLEPGEWIDLTIDFESQLPTIFARTGANGDYILAGQWYPKIAVFEKAGQRGRETPGWNCHQFHAHSEFYADFGNYDVTLTLPSMYQGRIGATGELVEEKSEGETVTVRFVQPGVHDFAWTADPRYLVLEETFDPVRDVPQEMSAQIAGWLGLRESEIALSPVKLTLFLQPQRRPQAEAYFESAKAAIRGYGLRLGAYPYSTLTIVDPASGAMGSGGMEYPTFITGGTHALLNYGLFEDVPMPETVTIHEFGHQYFQGMIASNEFEESWIDEGMNTFYEMEVTEEYLPPIRIFGAELETQSMRRASVRGGNFTDPIATESWGFYASGSYGRASYSRPGVTLHHLKKVLGDEIFHRAMRSFFQEWKFRHPSTEDFKVSFSRAVAEQIGTSLEQGFQTTPEVDQRLEPASLAVANNLESFFDQALHSTRELDYGVRSITSERAKADRGVFWQEGERVEIDPDGDEEKDESESETELYDTTVRFFRHGNFRQPVTLELRFEDGEVVRETWDDDRRWYRWEGQRASKLDEAVVDPEGTLSLDVDVLNNGLRREPRKAPVVKLLSNLAFWVQNLLQAVSIFS